MNIAYYIAITGLVLLLIGILAVGILTVITSKKEDREEKIYYKQKRNDLSVYLIGGGISIFMLGGMLNLVSYLI